MDISELEIPEVPIPARLLEEKAESLKSQRANSSPVLVRRKKGGTGKSTKSKAGNA